MKTIKSFSLAVLLLILASSAYGAEGSGGVNAPEHRNKPYLVLVSLDGFRWDYQDLYDTPALDRIARSGVRAERLIPVFPTLTFPNHYSIATGLYPVNHGVVGNTFATRDRKYWYSIRERETVEDGWWYDGIPIWVAAETAGMVSAAYYFVGTEAAIQGVAMTHWNPFDASVAGLHRVEKVLEWLALPEETRPHVITLYFEDVDTYTHTHGPGSKESIEAIGRVNLYLETLLDGIEALPHGEEVYVVVVSDHGQIMKNTDDIFLLDSVIDTKGLAIVDHGASAFVYVTEDEPGRAEQVRDAINAAWVHGKAYLPDEAPEHWHVKGDTRFADVIVQADPGYLVFSSEKRKETRSKGDHGWVPEEEGMHGIFLASGPRLPNGQTIGSLNVVDVYPLMMEILGLPITTPVDSDPQMLVPLLKTE